MGMTWPDRSSQQAMRDGEGVVPRDPGCPRERATQSATGELCLVGVLHSGGPKSRVLMQNLLILSQPIQTFIKDCECQIKQMHRLDGRAVLDASSGTMTEILDGNQEIDQGTGA